MKNFDFNKAEFLTNNFSNKICVDPSGSWICLKIPYESNSHLALILGIIKMSLQKVIEIKVGIFLFNLKENCLVESHFPPFVSGVGELQIYESKKILITDGNKIEILYFDLDQEIHVYIPIECFYDSSTCSKDSRYIFCKKAEGKDLIIIDLINLKDLTSYKILLPNNEEFFSFMIDEGILMREESSICFKSNPSNNRNDRFEYNSFEENKESCLASYLKDFPIYINIFKDSQTNNKLNLSIYDNEQLDLIFTLESKITMYKVGQEVRFRVFYPKIKDGSTIDDKKTEFLDYLVSEELSVNLNTGHLCFSRELWDKVN